MAAESAAPTRERCEAVSMDAPRFLLERSWRRLWEKQPSIPLQDLLHNLGGPGGRECNDASDRALPLISCWATLRSWHQTLPFKDAARVLSVETLRFINASLSGLSAVEQTELCMVIEGCRIVLGPLLVSFPPVCDVLLAAIAASGSTPPVLLQRLLEVDPHQPVPEEILASYAELSTAELLQHVECLRFWDLDWAVEGICRDQLARQERERQRRQRKQRRHQSGLEDVRPGLDGQPFLEHVLCILYRQRRIQELCTQTSSYLCHDGVQLVRGLLSQREDPERLDVAEALVHLFLVRDLLLSSAYCCTRELMVLWCRLQRLQRHAVPEVARAALRLLVPHAAHSAHFYLFIDVLWEHFGRRLFPIYVDFFVRGLTTDINFLQAAMHTENWSNKRELEMHMAGVLLKLATLFPTFPEVARECVLSSFALDPTEEKLAQLEWLTQQAMQAALIRNVGHLAVMPAAGHPEANGGKPCRCGGRCVDKPVLQRTSSAQADGRPEYEYDFWHPILSQQLPGVPYTLLKDLVSVLEGVRPRDVHLCSDWRRYLVRFETQRAARRSRTPNEYCGSADSETDSASEEDDQEEETRRTQEQIRKLIDCAGMPVKRRDKRRANAKCKSSRKKKKKCSRKHRKEAEVVDNADTDYGLPGLESTELEMTGLTSAELGLTRLGGAGLDSTELGPMELCPTGLESTSLEPTELDAAGLETMGLEPMELDAADLAPPLQEEKVHDPLQDVMPKVKKKSQKKGSHRKKDNFGVSSVPSGGGCLQTLRVVLERFDRLSGVAPNHLSAKKSALRVVPVLSLSNVSLEDESKRAYLWTDETTASKQPLSKLNLPQGPAFQRVANEFEARLQTTPLKRFLRNQIKRPTFTSKKAVPVKVSVRPAKSPPLTPGTTAKLVPVSKATPAVAASKAAAVVTAPKAASVAASKATTVTSPKATAVVTTPKATVVTPPKAAAVTMPKVAAATVAASKAATVTTSRAQSVALKTSPPATAKVTAMYSSKAAATIVTAPRTTCLAPPKIVPVAVPAKGVVACAARTPGIVAVKSPAMPVSKAPPHAIITRTQPITVPPRAPAVIVSKAAPTVVTRAPPAIISKPAVTIMGTSPLPVSKPVPAMVRPLKDYAKASKLAAAVSGVPCAARATGVPQSAPPVQEAVPIPTAPTPPAEVSTDAIDLPRRTVETTIQVQVPTSTCVMSPTPPPLPSHVVSLQPEAPAPVVQAAPHPVVPTSDALAEAVVAASQAAVASQAVSQAVSQAMQQMTFVTTTAPMAQPQPSVSCTVQASQPHVTSQPHVIVSSGSSLITNVSTDASQVLGQIRQGQATVLRLPVYSRTVQQQLGQAGVKTDGQGSVCMLPMKFLNAAMLSGQEKVLNVGNQKIAINALPSLLAASTSGAATLPTTVSGTVVSSGSPNMVSAKIVPTVMGGQNVQLQHQIQQLVRLNTIPGAIAAQVNASGNTTVLSADQLAGQTGLTNITALTLPLQGGLMGGRVIAGKIMIPVNSLLQQGSTLSAGGMPVIILKNQAGGQAKIITDATNLAHQVQVQQQVQHQVQVQQSIQQQVQQLQQQAQQQLQQQVQQQQQLQQFQQVQQLQQLQPNGTAVAGVSGVSTAATVSSSAVDGAGASATTCTMAGAPGATAAVKKTWMPIRSKPGAVEYRKACNMPPVKVTKAKMLAPVSSQQQQLPIVYTSPQATVSVTGAATRVVAQPTLKANLLPAGVTHLTVPGGVTVVAPTSVAGQITMPVTQKILTTARQVTMPLARLLQKPAATACKPAEAATSILQPQTVVVSAAQAANAAPGIPGTLVSSAPNVASSPCIVQVGPDAGKAEEDVPKPEASVAPGPPAAATAKPAPAALASQRTGIHLPFPEDWVDPSPSGATYVPVNSAELMPTGRSERQREEEESAKAYRRRKAALAMKARTAPVPKPQPLSQSTSKSLTAICDAVRCSLMVAEEEKDKVDAQATIKECQEYELDYSSDDSSDCSVEDLFEERALLRRLQHEEELNSILYVSDSVASEPDCDPYQWSSQSSLLLEQLNSDGDARDTMTPSSVGDSAFDGGSSLSKKLALKAKMSASLGGGGCQENGLQSPSKFLCDQCNRGFFSAYNLRRHQKNVHKMVFKSLLGSRDTPSPQQRVVVPTKPSSRTATTAPQSNKVAKLSPQPPKRTLFNAGDDDDESSNPDKAFCAQSVDEEQRLSFESTGLPSDSEESPLYGIKDEPSEPGISSLICDNASFNVIPQAPLDFFPRKEDNRRELSLSDMVAGTGARQQAPKSFVSAQAKSSGSPELSKNLDPADILESLEVAKMTAWTTTGGVGRGDAVASGAMVCKLEDEVGDAMEAEEAGLESLLGKAAEANHGGDSQEDDIDDIQPTVQHMGVSDMKDDEGQGSQEPWNAADQAALLEDIKAVESLGEYGTDSLDFFVAPRNVMAMQDQEGLLGFGDSSPPPPPPPPHMDHDDDAGELSEESEGAATPLVGEKLLEPRAEDAMGEEDKPCTSHCRTRAREASVKRSCPCCEDTLPKKRLTRSSSSGGKTRSATKKVRTR